MIAVHKTLQEADSELMNLIKNRIKWDQRVSLADIQIEIRGGVVVLTGFVDTTFKKNAAIDIVGSIEGVWAVQDDIIVPEDYFRTDEEIKKIVTEQIHSILKLSGEHIEIDVVDSVVKLEGEVFRPRLKAMASGIVWELSGVRDCLNFIEIVAPPQRVPRENVYESNQVQDFLADAARI